MGSQPGAVVLLGYHVIEPGLQVAPRLWYGIHPVVVRDGFFQLATLVAQFGRGERVQGMFRRLDGCWVGGHGRLVLTASGTGLDGTPRTRRRFAGCAVPATHVPRPGLPFEG